MYSELRTQSGRRNLFVAPRFREAQNGLWRQLYNSFVAPDVDRQAQASMFNESLRDGRFESHLRALLYW